MAPRFSCHIIGAGLSGLTAARQLAQHGVRVTVLEKNEIPGGRIATQFLHEGDTVAAFDCGAQFFTARSTEFQQAIAQWQNAGIAREWFRGQCKVLAGKVHHQADAYPRFCGVGPMSQIPQFLADELAAHGATLHLNAAVTRLDFNGQWTAEMATPNSAPSTFQADWLLLSAPLPQSLSLLESGNFVLPETVQRELQSAHYEPCLSVLLWLDGAGAVPEPGALAFANGPLSWLADNFQKGVSAVPGALTLHATPQFSRDHWHDNAETIVKVLADAAHPFLGAPLKQATVQRWRDAKVVALPHATDFLAWPAANLMMIGDAFGGAKIEGAFLSGRRAAMEMLADG